jgi:BirA family biotin operon repressor/biotin-[acetyl-CoA-carboxylase] ligase
MFIDETHSTSSLLRETYDDSLPHLFTIRTDFQTAGRGQAGNSWESEKGKNLLFSTLLRYPEVEAANQWRLSMLVAVAVREAITSILSPLASRLSPITIKWPNDIYYNDQKLVGILIENTLSGRHIAYTIAGVGINVNQTKWLSNAPNPVSMKQITGEEYNVEDLLNAFLEAIQRWEIVSTELLREEYIKHLYRRTGWHPYLEREVSVAPTNIQLSAQDADGVFLAQWVDITPQGEWVLRLKSGEEKRYHFKQIRFVL